VLVIPRWWGKTHDVTDAFDLTASAALADPFPVYRRLRESDPVHWSAAANGWLITRYEDVVRCLKEPRLSAARVGVLFDRMPQEMREPLQPLRNAFAHWMLMMDAPDHTRLRGLLGKAFAASLVAKLRPRVEALVDEHLAAIEPNGTTELIGELAHPVPALVIAELLGIEGAEPRQIHAWADDLALMERGPSAFHLAQASMLGMMEFMRGVANTRRVEPREDLISKLLAAEENGQVLNEQELLYTCVMLLFAGHETTKNLIGNGILELLRHPEQLRAVRENLDLVEPAIEELLRFHGSIQRVRRTVTEPFELGGKTLRTGDSVWLLVGAANRDPDVFRDPDRMDIERRPTRHLTFGFGPHFCVGATLARLEGLVAIRAILERLRDLRGPLAELRWRADLSFRGVVELPLAFTAVTR
jgi:cytochrome P450